MATIEFLSLLVAQASHTVPLTGSQVYLPPHQLSEGQRLARLSRQTAPLSCNTDMTSVWSLVGNLGLGSSAETGEEKDLVQFW